MCSMHLVSTSQELSSFKTAPDSITSQIFFDLKESMAPRGLNVGWAYSTS